MSTQATPTRDDFVWFMPMATRWKDNDRYGHVNNAVYYTLFENTIMSWLEVKHSLDANQGEVRCFTVENGCVYRDAVAYPDALECGLKVARLGNSSVRYELGIFVSEREPVAATADKNSRGISPGAGEAVKGVDANESPPHSTTDEQCATRIHKSATLGIHRFFCWRRSSLLCAPLMRLTLLNWTTASSHRFWG